MWCKPQSSLSLSGRGQKQAWYNQLWLNSSLRFARLCTRNTAGRTVRALDNLTISIWQLTEIKPTSLKLDHFRVPKVNTPVFLSCPLMKLLNWLNLAGRLGKEILGEWHFQRLFYCLERMLATHWHNPCKEGRWLSQRDHLSHTTH